MTRLRDLSSFPSSYNPSSMWLWTHDGGSDYKISIAQLRSAFSEVGAAYLQDADQNLAPTDTRITMGSLQYDAHDFTDTNSTGTFYIKSNKWQQVRLYASGVLVNTAFGYGFQFFKNGAKLTEKLVEHFDIYGGEHSFTMQSGTIPVSSGDYLNLYGTREEVREGLIQADNRSWFAIRPVRLI